MKSGNTYKNSSSKNIFFLFVRGSTNEIFQKLIHIQYKKLSWWCIAFRWWEYGGHKYHVKGLLRSVTEFNSSDFLPRAAIFWMHIQNVPRQNVLRQNVPWTKRPNGQSNLHTGTEFFYVAVEIWYSLLSGLWRRWRNEMAPLPARKSPGKNKNFWKLFLVFRIRIALPDPVWKCNEWHPSDPISTECCFFYCRLKNFVDNLKTFARHPGTGSLIFFSCVSNPNSKLSRMLHTE